MGAAAAAAVSKGSARKQGKKYLWGSERPGVLKRRVQIRMEQLPKKLEEVEERVARFRAAELARVEAERLFLEDQKALLNEHEELVRSKRFRPVSSYVVPDDAFTSEEIAAVLAENPGADEDVARIILKKRKLRAGNSNVIDVGSGASTASVSQPVSLDVQRDGQSGERSDGGTEQKAKPVEAPKAVHEKPKPAPVHIEASVTISSPTDSGDDFSSVGTDFSDFDPEAWIEGQDYPEDRYREIPDRDGNRILVHRTDQEDLSQAEMSPEVQALWARERELSKEQEELISRHGQVRMNWPQSAIDRLQSLSDEQIAIGIQLEKVLEG